MVVAVVVVPLFSIGKLKFNCGMHAYEPALGQDYLRIDDNDDDDQNFNQRKKQQQKTINIKKDLQKIIVKKLKRNVCCDVVFVIFLLKL